MNRKNTQPLFCARCYCNTSHTGINLYPQEFYEINTSISPSLQRRKLGQKEALSHLAGECQNYVLDPGSKMLGTKLLLHSTDLYPKSQEIWGMKAESLRWLH